MAEPFIAEIRLFPFNFAPQGWATCEGQTLSIVQNQPLYALLGATFGGDGRTVFNLPDLRGCVPVQLGGSVTWGQCGGEEQHSLTLDETPAHTHQAMADNVTATVITPAYQANDGSEWAPASQNPFDTAPADCALHASAIGSAGAGQAHGNMQPYLALNFCIALMGVWPPRD